MTVQKTELRRKYAQFLIGSAENMHNFHQCSRKLPAANNQHEKKWSNCI